MTLLPHSSYPHGAVDVREDGTEVVRILVTSPSVHQVRGVAELKRLVANELHGALDGMGESIPGVVVDWDGLSALGQSVEIEVPSDRALQAVAFTNARGLRSQVVVHERWA